MINNKFPYEDAIKFFSELYYGEHHIDGQIKPCGEGWQLNTKYSAFATFDFSNLTRLVLLAHRDAIRAEIRPSGPGMLKVMIHKRQREGKFLERHPDIEQAIISFNENKKS